MPSREIPVPSQEMPGCPAGWLLRNEEALGKVVCRRSLVWCVGLEGTERRMRREGKKEYTGWLGHAVLLARDILQPKVCSPALIAVSGWRQPQPWPVRAAPTDDSHPPWAPSSARSWEHPARLTLCVPEGCAHFSCPAWSIPPGTAAAPHPGVPPCPPQGPELGQSPAPRAHSRLEPCHGSRSCCGKDGAASPCNGIRPHGWWWRRGQGQCLPLHPNLWRITALAPYVALPSQPRAAPAT